MELDFHNWLLVFLRISAFLLVLPFFSATNFPVTMRVALAALMAVLLAPMLPHFPLKSTGFISLLGVMIQEVSIGLLLGFVSRMVFYAVDLAGNVIATEMGNANFRADHGRFVCHYSRLRRAQPRRAADECLRREFFLSHRWRPPRVRLHIATHCPTRDELSAPVAG